MQSGEKMSIGLFKFEDCLLKHHIRTEAWLPLCKSRLKTIRKNKKQGDQRKLRYFTFCAVGAIDVIMLDVEKVIRPSEAGFENVVFFDITPESVSETEKRIPGAIGFPGDFVDIVLMGDGEEENILETSEALLPPENLTDEYKTRRQQLQLDQRRKFIKCFPFDVINLDLEEFLFKPTQDLPGKVVNALRKIFDWQHKPLKNNHQIDGFSLMFTTQIGPPNLSAEYIDMLGSRLKSNLDSDGTLKESLKNKLGHSDIERIQREKFDLFFELSIPKILAAILMESDWYVDPDLGIKTFELERPWREGTYKILHLIMDVRKKEPPREKRGPGVDSQKAQEAYRKVVRQVFSDNVVVISDESINKKELQDHLARVRARRRKYYPDEITT